MCKGEKRREVRGEERGRESVAPFVSNDFHRSVAADVIRDYTEA